MPHIDLPPLPGIAALLAGYPQTGGPLDDPADYDRQGRVLAEDGYLRTRHP